MRYRAHTLFALSHNGEKAKNPVLWFWPITLKFSGCRVDVKIVDTCSCKQLHFAWWNFAPTELKLCLISLWTGGWNCTILLMYCV